MSFLDLSGENADNSGFVNAKCSIEKIDVSLADLIGEPFAC